jgi:hypothetical protein
MSSFLDIISTHAVEYYLGQEPAMVVLPHVLVSHLNLGLSDPNYVSTLLWSHNFSLLLELSNFSHYFHILADLWASAH